MEPNTSLAANLDWLQFIARLVEAVSWPLAAILIVYLFHSEIRQLLAILTRVKAGPVEADFERRVAEVLEISELSQPNDAEQQQDDSRGGLDDWSERLIRVAEISTRAAVLSAWSDVEGAIRRAALRVSGGDSPPPDVRSTIGALKILQNFDQIGLIDIKLIHDLRGLRNEIAHIDDVNPSFSSTLEYIKMSDRVLRQLNFNMP